MNCKILTGIKLPIVDKCEVKVFIYIKVQLRNKISLKDTMWTFIMEYIQKISCIMWNVIDLFCFLKIITALNFE